MSKIALGHSFVTPQSEVIEVYTFPERKCYTRFTFNGGSDAYSSLTDSGYNMALEGKFIEFRSLRGITRKYNIDAVKSITENLVKTKIITKSNNRNYHSYYVYIFFHPANTKIQMGLKTIEGGAIWEPTEKVGFSSLIEAQEYDGFDKVIVE